MESRTDGLLSIGRFAALTGLTVVALRHYDDVGLLEPSYVDPSSGYRWYAPTQGTHAQIIRRLRDLGVTIPDITTILAAIGDGDRLQDLLEREEIRVAAAVVAATRAQDELASIGKELLTMSTRIDEPRLIGPIASVRVFTRDLDAARVFYRDHLGLPELSSTPSWAVLQAGPVQLIVETDQPDPGEEPAAGRFTGFSFAVDDAAGVCEVLARRGVDIVGPPEVQPWGGTLAHIADPDSNVLTLVQYPRD
jgi:DNA-binding transcriptional MerR regulator/catechol 2,3-dioxygenase-like lactoylglutathione lyase family enzyme